VNAAGTGAAPKLRTRRDAAREQARQLARIADALERLAKRRDVDRINREYVTAAQAALTIFGRRDLLSDTLFVYGSLLDARTMFARPPPPSAARARPYTAGGWPSGAASPTSFLRPGVESRAGSGESPRRI
jgi:hypothetical protein